MSDASTEVRVKLVKGSGEGAFVQLLDRLRELGEGIQEAQLLQVFESVGLPLSLSESRRLCSETGKTPAGLLSTADLIRNIAGGLSKCRQNAVQKAWKSIAGSADGTVAAGLLINRFDPSRNPEVLLGHTTAEAEKQKFLQVFAGRELVHRTSFLDYYTAVSASQPDDQEFVITVTKSWRLDQPTKLNPAELRGRINDGFQGSAYRGVDGKPPPSVDEHAVKERATMRFATMISNDIDPFPIGKKGLAPPQTLGSYQTTTARMNDKTQCFRGGRESIGNVVPFDGEHSTFGLVPNGLHDATGFLTFEAETGSKIGKGRVDDDVMGTFWTGKEKERQHEARRIELAGTPFATPDPNGYYQSTQEHALMNAAARGLEPALTIHSQRRAASQSRTSQGDTLGSTVSPVTIDGRLKADYSESLQATLLKNKEESLPRNSHAPVGAKSWETTQRTHFAEYDTKAAQEMNSKFAGKPVSHRSEELTAEGDDYVKAVDARWANRHEGRYTTETSVKLRDRSSEASVDHKYDVRGTFVMREGCRQMSPKAHHPRDVRTNQTYNVDNVVPGHFTSTNTTVETFLDQRRLRGY